MTGLLGMAFLLAVGSAQAQAPDPNAHEEATGPRSPARPTAP
jgi:hypothetical protein